MRFGVLGRFLSQLREGSGPDRQMGMDGIKGGSHDDDARDHG
ncbi:hypothetical protein FHR70_003904 [Microvirga lupini]|uniref:Uncharacterized protein n=1 Tax=Microvirga lupini TaxID=420324 RepID=A0A7W4VPG3_9HYPH|nr:hypothetical protein [Microvirga lupini]